MRINISGLVLLFMISEAYSQTAEGRLPVTDFHVHANSVSNIGPPGAPYLRGTGKFRARLNSPLIIEEALVRHPGLRVCIMHAGWSMTDAGSGKRIMYGSDQMSWPNSTLTGIESIENAEFLTPDQKRDILYNNAARFLRLCSEDTAEHHSN